MDDVTGTGLMYIPGNSSYKGFGVRSCSNEKTSLVNFLTGKTRAPPSLLATLQKRVQFMNNNTLNGAYITTGTI